MTKKSTVASPVPAGGQKAETPTSRRVVVILGSGRSGTSLCAKILSRLGITMEATLQRPNEMNPEGYFEDARLVEINKRLLEKLAPVADIAPSSDVAVAKIAPEIKQLRAHLRERTSAASGVWGFKDPRVSLLLPIYRRAFQAEGLVPSYVFCARSADAVTESLIQATGKSRVLCEHIYFLRTFMALRDCAANCYVLHYERLLESPTTQIANLGAYVSGDGKACNLSETECEGLIERNFNRSALRAKQISNPLASRMEALLNGMNGLDFDRELIFNEIREIDAINSGYQAWVDLVMEAVDTLKDRASISQEDGGKKEQEWAARCISAETRAKESETRREEAEVNLARQTNCATALSNELSTLQAKIIRLEEERNAAIARVRSHEGDYTEVRRAFEPSDKNSTRESKRENILKNKNTELRKEIEQKKRKLTEAMSKLASANEEIERLSGSVRHRAGTLLVEASRRPGWNTLALPWRLVRLRADAGLDGDTN